mgnify:FL=1
MSGKYEGYLQAMLAPLGLYDLTGGRQQGGELALGEVVVFAHIADAAVVCHKMSS